VNVLRRSPFWCQDLSGQIEQAQHSKIGQSNSIERLISELLIFFKTCLGRRGPVENQNQVSGGSSYLRITREPEIWFQALICSIEFCWFGNQLHTKFGVRFRSIAEVVNFSKTTNCTRHMGSFKYNSVFEKLLGLIYSDLHWKSFDLIPIQIKLRALGLSVHEAKTVASFVFIVSLLLFHKTFIAVVSVGQ